MASIPLSAVPWAKLLDQYDRRCYYCGWQADALVQEHKLPRVRGGSDDPANIVPACTRCNAAKGSRTEGEFMAYLHDTGLGDKYRATPPPVHAPRTRALRPVSRKLTAEEIEDRELRHAHFRLSYPTGLATGILLSQRLAPGAKIVYMLACRAARPADDPRPAPADPFDEARIAAICQTDGLAVRGWIEELIEAGFLGRDGKFIDILNSDDFLWREYTDSHA